MPTRVAAAFGISPIRNGCALAHLSGLDNTTWRHTSKAAIGRPTISGNSYFGLFGQYSHINERDRLIQNNTGPTCTMATPMKSIYITDTRCPDLGTFIYLYEFAEGMVPDRAWKTLMVLEEKGEFYFPSVGDSGFHALVTNVHHRQLQDLDSVRFFELAMAEEHQWPRKNSTREASMKQLANCSWIVNLVEE